MERFASIVRQINDERRTYSRLAVGGDAAGMLLDDLPADCQPDPAARILATPVQSLEGLEDALKELLLEPNAVILHTDLKISHRR